MTMKIAWQLGAIYGGFLGGLGFARGEGGWWLAVFFALVMLARSHTEKSL